LRISGRIILLVCLLAVACDGGGGDRHSGRERGAPVVRWASLHPAGRLYFVPLGGIAAARVEDLAAFYRRRLRLTVEVLPRVPLERRAVDRARRQLVSERLIGLMRQAYPALDADRGAILIGLADADMYNRSIPRWRYSFSNRLEDRFAVVSSARMGWSDTGRPQPERVAERLRKMVTKNIGVLVYRLAQSDDPRSPLYRAIGGPSDFDLMREDF
jgi:hypothetical protein